jgi:hypothetical protein
MVSSSIHVPSGYISLYELNVNRDSEEFIYPFLPKDGTSHSFKTVTVGDYNSQYNYGDTIQGSYPLSASLYRNHFPNGGGTRKQITALKNVTNHYRHASEHYKYSSSLGDKSLQDITIIDIPSIFFGSSIKKGSVDLRFYVSGALHGMLRDSKGNGELIQHSGVISTNDGSVAGVCLYNEGIILLTGSWAFSGHTDDYENIGADNPRWIYWGSSGTVGDRLISSSYELTVSGTNYIPTITMFAHAPKGRLNNSANPTFVDYRDAAYVNTFASGSHMYEERKDLRIKNITKMPYSGSSGSFEKETYISKVGIYDEKKNLLAVAKLAVPVKKTATRDFSFKMKVDI